MFTDTDTVTDTVTDTDTVTETVRLYNQPGLSPAVGLDDISGVTVDIPPAYSAMDKDVWG